MDERKSSGIGNTCQKGSCIYCFDIHFDIVPVLVLCIVC